MDVAALNSEALLFAVVLTVIALGLLADFLVRDRGWGRRLRPRAAAERGEAGQQAVELLGIALAATHEPEALFPVILEGAIETTGAAGGRLETDGEVLLTGGAEQGGERLVLGLGPDEPSLVLFSGSGAFSGSAATLATSFASQAAIALANARHHTEVQHQAMTDELTGLMNRRRFMQALAQEVSRVERFGGEFSLLLGDLDDFKQINDRFGHVRGDEALRALAEIFTGELRGIDTVARLGGEEFVALLPETDLEGAVAAAERLRLRTYESELELEPGEPVRLSVSFGVVEAEAGVSPVELLRRADDALYQAKLTGKNRVCASR